MIGRLFEQEDRWLLREGGAKLPALSLTGRQGVPALQIVRAEPETRPPARRTPLPVPAKVLDGRRECVNTLPAEVDAPRRETNVTLDRRQLAGKKTQNGGLAGTVWADQATDASGQVKIYGVEEGITALPREIDV